MKCQKCATHFCDFPDVWLHRLGECIRRLAGPYRSVQAEKCPKSVQKRPKASKKRPKSVQNGAPKVSKTGAPESVQKCPLRPERPRIRIRNRPGFWRFLYMCRGQVPTTTTMLTPRRCTPPRRRRCSKGIRPFRPKSARKVSKTCRKVSKKRPKSVQNPATPESCRKPLRSENQCRALRETCRKVSISLMFGCIVVLVGECIVVVAGTCPLLSS